MLTYFGAYVKAASSAKEALAQMENLLPNAIVVRLSSADMFTLLGRARLFPPGVGGSVPIVRGGSA